MKFKKSNGGNCKPIGYMGLGRSSLSKPNVVEIGDGETYSLQALKAQVLSDPKRRQKFIGKLAALEAGHFVRGARQWASLTQAQLADALGCDQSYISQVENTKSSESVSLSFLARVADQCGGAVRIEFDKSPLPQVDGATIVRLPCRSRGPRQ